MYGSALSCIHAVGICSLGLLSNDIGGRLNRQSEQIIYLASSTRIVYLYAHYILNCNFTAQHSCLETVLLGAPTGRPILPPGPYPLGQQPCWAEYWFLIQIT